MRCVYSAFAASLSRAYSMSFAYSISFELIYPLYRTYSTEISGYVFDPFKRGFESHSSSHAMVEVIKKAAVVNRDSSAMAFLHQSGIVPDKSLIHSSVWALRQNWKLAILGFMWGEKLNRTDEESRDLIVWILGSHSKFNTAWMMIREWQRSSINVRRQMLVMIDRYAAANVPERASWTFKLMERFRASPDEQAYRFLLSSLCNHGFVDEAEEFMLLSKNLFPLDVVCFNILLNASCNSSVDVLEAKRIWRQMSRYCIVPNAISYTHMISCFSKVGNLFDSLRLYDGMKKKGWVPSVDVYHSLVYVLTRENCLGEALKMAEKSKENGWEATCETYNIMISTLCEIGRTKEATLVLKRMEDRNICPDVKSFCYFVEAEETGMIFEEMKSAKVHISSKLGLQILSKVFELQKAEHALRVWGEMNNLGVVMDAPHYSLMVEELLKCGMPDVARQLFYQMRLRGYRCDPKFLYVFTKH